MTDRIEFPSYEVCLSADLKYIEKKAEYLQECLPSAFDALDCLLDAATILPVCEEGYQRDSQLFSKHSNVYNYLQQLISVLGEYGISVTLPALLAEKLPQK